MKTNLNLNPWFVTTDFEPGLMNAALDIFPGVDLVPCFFHFAKCLWVNAAKCGLKRRFIVKDVKQLIFSLKALCFRPPKLVMRWFESIKTYESKGKNFTAFLEYFEHEWLDGVFKIKDWSYFDKIWEFDELAITNNGLESFHQMIKS